MTENEQKALFERFDMGLSNTNFGVACAINKRSIVRGLSVEVGGTTKERPLLVLTDISNMDVTVNHSCIQLAVIHHKPYTDWDIPFILAPYGRRALGISFVDPIAEVSVSYNRSLLQRVNTATTMPDVVFDLIQQTKGLVRQGRSEEALEGIRKYRSEFMIRQGISEIKYTVNEKCEKTFAADGSETLKEWRNSTGSFSYVTYWSGEPDTEGMPVGDSEVLPVTYPGVDGEPIGSGVIAELLGQIDLDIESDSGERPEEKVANPTGSIASNYWYSSKAPTEELIEFANIVRNSTCWQDISKAIFGTADGGKMKIYRRYLACRKELEKRGYGYLVPTWGGGQKS